MDRLTSLNTFIEAAETRSFTAAGRKLGISSSAVGKSIARLETRLGVRLFNRSTRSISLTTEGESFRERCKRIFAEIEAAEEEMAQSHSAPRGRLVVSMPLVGTLLTLVIGDFARDYPAIELDLDFSDRVVDVIEEGFDVVMRTGAAVDSQLMTRTLGTYSYVIVGSPDYLARAGTPEQPEDLLGHVCLRHRWPMTGKLEDWRIYRDEARLDLALPVSVIASSIEPLIAMAERGVGLAHLPTFAVRQQLEAGALISVLDWTQRDTGTFRMLWPSGRQSFPKVRAFVDHVSKHLFTDPSRL